MWVVYCECGCGTNLIFTATVALFLAARKGVRCCTVGLRHQSRKCSVRKVLTPDLLQGLPVSRMSFIRISAGCLLLTTIVAGQVTTFDQLTAACQISVLQLESNVNYNVTELAYKTAVDECLFPQLPSRKCGGIPSVPSTFLFELSKVQVFRM